MAEHLGAGAGHHEAEKKVKLAHDRIYSDLRSSNGITPE